MEGELNSILWPLICTEPNQTKRGVSSCKHEKNSKPISQRKKARVDILLNWSPKEKRDKVLCYSATSARHNSTWKVVKHKNTGQQMHITGKDYTWSKNRSGENRFLLTCTNSTPQNPPLQRQGESFFCNLPHSQVSRKKKKRLGDDLCPRKMHTPSLAGNGYNHIA